MPHTTLHAPSPDGSHCMYCGDPEPKTDAPCEGPLPLRRRLKAAERSLQRAGYTYRDGAEGWKPPLGPLRNS